MINGGKKMDLSFEFGKDSSKKSIRNKGRNILAFPKEFVVIDIETTGLDPQFDEIIEVGALKIINGKVIDTFNTLVKPVNEIDDYITDLTGITNEMLKNAPMISSVIVDFYKFVGNNIILGHNVNFDINFLYDDLFRVCTKELNNDFVDTMRIGRYLLKDLKHHRLIDIANYYNIVVNGNHRALKDCEITLEVYESMLKEISERYDGLDNFLISCKRVKTKLDINEIKTANTEFDISHPLYNQCCVFTGTLEKMSRREAMQKVVDVGGICSNGVTKETNYLILGNNDYNPLIKNGKSNKQRKAEQLKLSGYDIEVISENVFYEMLDFGLKV